MTNTLEGVMVVPLRRIPDERGMVMHFLRCDAAHFEKFGEVYFATAYPGAIKGWHLHKTMTLNYVCVTGMIKLVLFDRRKESSTSGVLQEIFIGDQNYCLVKIPPGLWNGWKCIGSDAALLANCATEPHRPDEMERLDPFSPEIPYKWDIVMK